MKVTCLQENLARGLGIVGRAVAMRSTLPITSNVLISTEHGRIKLAATNLDIALSCWIGGQIEDEGAITVPARLITDFVNSLPAEKIAMTLAPRSRQVKLVCARNEATIGGMDADDFPPIPAVEGDALDLDAKMLREAIAQVVFSAATDDSRPVLTGVDLVVEGNKLTLAAADGFRLAVRTLDLKKKAGERQEVIVPAKALAELSRLLQDQDEPVKMTFNANKTQVLFRLKDVELVAQLIQGTFPDYSRLIPKEWQSRAVVEVRDFLQETKIASIFARDGSGIVRITFLAGEEGKPGEMTVSARAEEIGDNSGVLDATVEGEPSKIAFNGKYLQEVLGVLDGGRVALETTGPSQPGVIRPIDNDNYIHVVMPMFVQW
ncbi:MAG: DNA polymerase III subunit beta [Dehalococcoidia bacterium]|nr:MAG: DNA polymerase III subunit beta [Dehalococcoidia bacterium]